jgi:AraC family transcriptional regulator of adaptative response/methylated-DNA-[protein]-cysteine methyltransferase
MGMIHMAPIPTPIGEMIAGATDTHLVMFEFEHRKMYNAQIERLRKTMSAELVPGESPVFEQLRDELDEYFAGARRDFTVPLSFPGTPFQMRVWSALRQIPSGATTSYKRLAESIGQPDAVRAVARANGDNRIAILIPCHRVIGSDGKLVGYGGGLWRKRKLLELEAQHLTLSLFAG